MDYNTLFGEDYRKLLSDISNNFESNLNRVIRDDIRRLIARENPPVNFKHVGFSSKGIQIQLENIKLITRPTLNMEHLKVDFVNLLLDTNFDVNALEFTADYQFITQVLGTDASQQGSMRFGLTGMSISGKIGIFITEDSFMPVNYDLNYNSENIKIETTQYTPVGEPCVHNCYQFKELSDVADAESIESTIRSMFWPQVEKYFSNLLHRLIAGNVVEYSVGEMLLDEPEYLKGYQEHRSTAANFFFDKWLEQLKQEYTTNITESFKVTLQDGNHKCKIETAPGKLQNITTLKRISDTSCIERVGELVAWANITLHDFTYVLDCCKINCMNNLLEGTIKFTPQTNKIFIKFVSPSSGPRKVFAKFLDIGQLDVESDFKLQDTETFTCVMEKLMPYSIGHVQHYSNSVLQKIVQKYNDKAQ